MQIGKPDAEVQIDRDLIRSLLAKQHPDLARLGLGVLNEGWDNVTCRLGTELSVRLPRRAAAVERLQSESDWLSELASLVGVEVPTHVRSGRPGRNFPWRWSVAKWVDGSTAETEPLNGAAAFDLARELRKLHIRAPREAPVNPLRAVPLRNREADVLARFDQIMSLTRHQVEQLKGIWHQGLSASEATERVWVHGDLHPANIIVHHGQLAGIIDWGDLSGGDRATDLACAWMLLPSAGRDAFWETYEADQDLYHRSAAWAVFFAIALLECGERQHEVLGRLIINRLTAK